MAKKAAAKKPTTAAKKVAAKKAPVKTAAKKAPAKKTAPKPQTPQSKGTATMAEDTARGSIVKLRVPYNAQTLSAVATRLGKKKMLRRELQDHLMEVVKTYLSESGAPALGTPTPASSTEASAQAALPLAEDADDLLG